MNIVEKFATDSSCGILTCTVSTEKSWGDDVDGLQRQQISILEFLRASRCLKARRVEYALLTTMGSGFLRLCMEEFRANALS